MGKRSEFEMITDLLDAVYSHPKAPISRLVTYSNMSYAKVKKRVDLLLSKNFIKIVETKSIRNRVVKACRITPLGHTWLTKAKMLWKELF